MPLDLDPHIAVLYDRIPKGEVELACSSEVLSADGDGIGHLAGFVVDDCEQVTHVVVECGHLFGRHEVAVPVADVTRVATDSVSLGLTKEEVHRLP